MTHTKPLILAAALLALASTTIDAQARAGGGVSVGRSSSVSSSSSRAAPSYRPPSYTSPAAPAPRYTPPPPRTEPSRSGSSGLGSSFLGSLAGSTVGTMVGNAISRPDVVAPGAAVAAPAAAAGVAGAPMVSAAPTVIERPLIGAGGLLLLLAAGAGGVWWWTRRRSQSLAQYRGHIPPRPVPARPDACSPRPADMDPVVLFYSVQQAAMDDDQKALDRYCTQGLALLLSGSPEPGRDARTTLTGLTWRDDSDAFDRAVAFTFIDTAAPGQVARERWIFDDAGELAGIEVL